MPDRRKRETVLSLLFPRRCPFCGAIVGQALLCSGCRTKLPFTKEHAVVEGGFGRCAAPLYYEETVRRALLDFKFKGKMGGLDCFGMLLADCAAEHFSGQFDTVTWVPVSRKRRRDRGFDQSRCLADRVCAAWDMQPVTTLCKAVDTPPQSGINTPEGRRANVLGVYETVPENVCGRKLLLIDDILTTGATLGECVRVLKEAGAADVVCLTVARTRNGRIMPKQTAHNSKVYG